MKEENSNQYHFRIVILIGLETILIYLIKMDKKNNIYIIFVSLHNLKCGVIIFYVNGRKSFLPPYHTIYAFICYITNNNKDRQAFKIKKLKIPNTIQNMRSYVLNGRKFWWMSSVQFWSDFHQKSLKFIRLLNMKFEP